MSNNTSKIEQAFEKIDRAGFVLEAMKSQVGFDAPLPIGYGQTISQPTTVRLMLEWLDAAPGHRVLDIGSGSGWTTALLANIIGSSGQVYAVERIPELLEFGRINCERTGIKNAKFYEAGKEYGLKKHAPYDRILVSASAQELPKELLPQLKIDGKLVIPVQNDILEIQKNSETEYKTRIHSGFVFVPLI